MVNVDDSSQITIKVGASQIKIKVGASQITIEVGASWKKFNDDDKSRYTADDNSKSKKTTKYCYHGQKWNSNQL